MGNGNEFDAERRKLNGAALLHNMGFYIWRIRLHQAFGFEQPRSKRRRIDGALQPWPQLCNRADVVFMRMGDDEREQILADFFNEADVWHDEVNARQIRPGERNAKINHNPFAVFFRAVAIKPTVHADFAQAAQRHEHQTINFFRHTNPSNPALALSLAHIPLT